MRSVLLPQRHQAAPAGPPMISVVDAIGTVAAARELLSLVFYGLRDGHIRALHRTSA
ncbi:MAG: hypothetical protein ACRDTE_17775 [Pseudonocardiaceae bacterium]